MAGQHLPLLSFQKKADKLDMNVAELSVWAVQEGQHHPCIARAKETNIALNYFICEIRGTSDTAFQQLVVNLFCHCRCAFAHEGMSGLSMNYYR